MSLATSVASGWLIADRPLLAIVGGVGAIAFAVSAATVTVRAIERLLDRARLEADLDPLTKALNRAAFARLGGRRLAGDQASMPWGIVMVDLDDFGAFNKREGHLTGDRVLCAAVQRMNDAVGRSGLVGRLGGDELAAFVPADRAAACGRAILLRLLSEPHPVSASVGVATAPTAGCDWVTLLQEADVALRCAKREGKGQVVEYVEGLDAGEQLTRRQLSEAIDEEAMDILVQPIVDLGTGDVHAYEALARFRADGGPTSPTHWLAMAEPLGMRVELELACLRSSLRLLDGMRGDARLAVNLSAPALHDPRTRRLLLSHTPQRLIVELTEESLARDMRSLRADLTPLLEAGMKLAVDDMGAGYSNLRQVVELSPSLVKLDRTLVHGIDRDRSQRLLIDALTGYAQRTGAAIVAEGIETEAELEVVRELGVSYGQGYLLARPASPWPEVNISLEAPETRGHGVRGSRPVTIAPETTAEEARARFIALRELECLVIVDEHRRPLASVTRHHLLTVLGHRFGYALWGERPVLRIADTNCLQLPLGASLDELAQRSLARPVERRHDPILLIDGRGRLVSHVTMSDLLLARTPGKADRRAGQAGVQAGLANRASLPTESTSSR